MQTSIGIHPFALPFPDRAWRTCARNGVVYGSISSPVEKLTKHPRSIPPSWRTAAFLRAAAPSSTGDRLPVPDVRAPRP